VQELVGVDRSVGADARRERREVGGVHPQGIDLDHAPVVPGTPVANQLLHLVEAVHLEVSEEAERFDDARDVVEFLTIREVQRMPCETLDRALDELHLSVDVREEGHVADAEAAVLHDRRAALV